MVSPVHIVSIALATAFLMGIAGKRHQSLLVYVLMLAVAAMTMVSGSWLWAIFSGAQQPLEVFTAGFKPPFAINLRMSLDEAFLTTLINFFGLATVLYLWDVFKKSGNHLLSIFVIYLLGLNVMVMTRDLFNLFVFLEIASIATAGLMIMTQNSRSIAAGFKFMIASSVISGILLIGIIFAYAYTGTLNIDFMTTLPAIKGGAVAAFFILTALLLESKPFPANGWALDMYHSAHHSVGAALSALSAPAVLFVIYKVMPIIPESWTMVISLFGLISFAASNFLAMRQDNVRRMLGYSSVAQGGLMLATVGMANYLGEQFYFIAIGFLLTNYFAKAGLFWLGGIVNSDDQEKWTFLRKKPILFFLFGLFIAAMAGLPPFPSFFAKWEFIMQIAQGSGWGWITLILLGSIFEIVFLFKWFGRVFRSDISENEESSAPWYKQVPVMIFGAGLLAASYFFVNYLNFDAIFVMLPLLFIAAFFVLDFLPAVVKNLLLIASLAVFGYTVYPEISDNLMQMLFMGVFLLGGIMTLIPGFVQKGSRAGFYPFAAMTVFGLIMLVNPADNLTFFMGWELMALGSYILILRGKNAEKPAFRYMIFSAGGAYLMMAAFGMLYAIAGPAFFATLAGSLSGAGVIFILLALAFMLKAAAIGLHIWLPGAYSEAEDDATPLVSGVLINSGVLGLFWLITTFGPQQLFGVDIFYLMGWIGAITAIGGNMLAIYEEDMKRLIAYSSVGAMGYIIFALSMNTKVGLLIALYYMALHFIYKTMLFISAAGVMYRTKKRNMYEMGGLIKNMPLSFIVVLIGIITLAGMPPLAGFAGKWMFYNAVAMKGWYIQGTMVFFSGIVAFLYLYKLIASVFLGQLKDNLRKVKEAPLVYLIPQFIFVMAIMLLSVQPRLLLEPLATIIPAQVPGEMLQWDGNLASTSFGYWNAFSVMSVVVVMFATLLGWLMYHSRKAQKVKQFNIVFAAERPFRPETTHVSYNMFAGYKKALGFLMTPLATRFWTSLSSGIEAIADKVRTWYTGNGQTYALHLLIYAFVLYLTISGGKLL
ncbi:MAG: NADH-quinone oxidoreductase subunit F [Bacteroidetes bacterium HGW-Bacteroidetes-6]|jgi:formate hydrogenlyase subunit 3/multisubunit Na+/H+ antiporter MnhD subunit|nr:MAG: NADH-quinone oxidoreductase subunit F [Bacteroidetes bacterium HGW-Bacteroidetes-6]